MRRILIYVLGLGCSEIKNLESIELLFERQYKIPCMALCNKSIGKTIRNIGKSVCRLPPSKRSSFVIEVFNKVIYWSNRNYNVTVLGHSYGGSVVSRVAEMLSDRGISRRNLKMITTGSTYVPKPQFTKGVNIIHLMFKNDIVLRCNHLSPTRDPFVKWLVHKNYKNYNPMFYNIFGSEIEWEIHNDYSEILKNILEKIKKNKNANLRNLVAEKKNIKKTVLLSRHNAPRIKKPIRLNNVNLKTYSNLYKKIRIQTNIPGTYGLRKKLLSNLGKKLTVHNYIATNNFKPHEQKEFYYLPFGKDVKQWLYLLPESYKSLKTTYGNRPFYHFVLRNSGPKIYVQNFKRVIK